MVFAHTSKCYVYFTIQYACCQGSGEKIVQYLKKEGRTLDICKKLYYNNTVCTLRRRTFTYETEQNT